MNASQIFSALGFLLVATALEVSGDATVRLAIFNHAGLIRLSKGARQVQGLAPLSDTSGAGGATGGE
jgi:hypothetical protein